MVKELKDRRARRALLWRRNPVDNMKNELVLAFFWFNSFQAGYSAFWVVKPSFECSTYLPAVLEEQSDSQGDGR